MKMEVACMKTNEIKGLMDTVNFCGVYLQKGKKIYENKKKSHLWDDILR